MSKKLSVISGREMAKILVEHRGFTTERKGHLGSHILMKKGEIKFHIPDHKELSIGSLRRTLRKSGISREEFEALRQKKKR